MKKIILFLIRTYQEVSVFLPRHCRFYPSCSEYAYEAVNRCGIIKGSFYALRRLLRCHPFHPGGYDPVRMMQTDSNQDSY